MIMEEEKRKSWPTLLNKDKRDFGFFQGEERKFAPLRADWSGLCWVGLNKRDKMKFPAKKRCQEIPRILWQCRGDLENLKNWINLTTHKSKKERVEQKAIFEKIPINSLPEVDY